MNKVKIFISIIVLGLLCTACGKKEVDYDISTELATGTDVQIPHNDDKVVEERFEDKIAKGDITITINAYVDLPDTQVFNVYKASEVNYELEEDEPTINGYQYWSTKIGDNYEIYMKEDVLHPGYDNGVLDDAETYSLSSCHVFECIDPEDEDIKPYIEAAETFVNNLDLDGTFTVKYYQDIKAHESGAHGKYVDYGYEFVMLRNLDGITCDGSDYYFPFTNEDENYDWNQCRYFEKIYITIDPLMNPISFRYNSPLRIDEKVSTNVNVIDYEKAKALILDELNKRMTNYSESYEYMTLEYMRIRNEDGYAIIPVWCLKAKVWHQTNFLAGAIVINALDGSVIKPEEEIFFTGK